MTKIRANQGRTWTRLPQVPYMKFPFQVTDDGPRQSTRTEHVREIVEQVLFTDPGERVYRPGFGAGVRLLVFEPNNEALREVARQRLTASLADALRGEVDPKSLRVEARSQDAALIVTITYTLAAIGVQETQQFRLNAEGASVG